MIETGNELLTEDESSGLIATIVRRTRQHPDIARGASVRGAIALKQVLDGFALLGNGITRSGIEKAAMITLPPRIETRRGGGESAEAIVRAIVREVLYGGVSSGEVHSPKTTDKTGKLSLDEFLAALQNLSLSKTMEAGETVDNEDDGNMEIVAGSAGDGKRLAGNTARDSRFKDRKNWFPDLEKVLKEMLGELEQKLIEGEISEGDYRYQKKKLEDMLNTASYLESGAAGREIAETVMELMEAGDRQWQKDLDFQDMYVYYHIRESQGDSGLTMPKKNWYALKVIVDFLEKEELVESGEEGTTFSLTEKAMDIMLESLVADAARNGKRKSQIRRINRNATERRQDSRRYATGDVFRDISVRRTLREIAKKRRKLSEINRHDLRIFLKDFREQKSDIMLCVDSSGSMGFHRKLILARLTAAAIARTAIQNGDRVGVVTFDDLGRSVVSPTDREDEVMRYITGISSGGNTNIGDGLKVAATLLRRERSRNQKVIMLITDGEPTAISEKAMTAMGGKKEKDMTGEYAVLEARSASASGIETSVVHITDEKNAGKKLVENVAKAGHGEVRRVIRPDDLRAIML